MSKAATRALALSLFTFLCLWMPRTAAQEADFGATDRIVDSIDIQFADLVTVSREAVLARVQLREGMPYSQQLVDRSIRSLYATLLFDTIEAQTVELPNNRVQVIFTVRAKYRIEDIIIEGAREISRNRLFRDFTSRVGGILDDRRLQVDADMMRDLYQERGFTEARIDFDVVRNAETGRGVVTYRITEGPRLKIKRVDFVGNAAFSDRKLRGEMDTRRRWMFSWLTGSGRFDEVEFQEDLEKLRAFYLKEGYLDVSIAESSVTLEYPSPNEIVITIQVSEGRLYSVGEISFEGNVIFDNASLYSILRLLPGDTFSPPKLDEDVKALEDVYGSFGYLDTTVRPDRRANVQTGNIDLVYRFREGERFDVESIVIEGNVKTKSTVIVRELALAPGRNFNLIYMKNSEARLQNTRFFEDVQVTPETSDIPGRRNLKIRVREGRTGNLQFGAGFSSIESVVVFFEVSQSNFDLFKWRSPLLQGDGQKFRLRGSIGSRSNEVTLYFEEPWLFEQRLAAGFELFRRESDYNSALYNELRTGLEIFLRKRLFGLVDGQVSYGLQSIDLRNVRNDIAPGVIVAEAAISPRIISKVDFTLVRDTRNNLVFTTRGSRVSFGTTFAGIGGDTEYMKFETRNSFFIPVFETGDQVIQIIARAGTFWSYGETDNPVFRPGTTEIVGREGEIPFFDRFYLGGPNSLRGFEYREVSPIARVESSGRRFNEPIGGNTYGFGSIEYTVEVAQPLRLAVFYDWGFVNRDDFDFDPTSFNDNWGFGIRLQVLGNPLRLDYGIPITPSRVLSAEGEEIYTNDQGGQFNFSFGTRF